MIKKFGYVSIIGRPNVGKSTLLNSIISHKVAITSDKSGTTRNLIQGVYNDDDSQIVFIDTPGIHKPQSMLGKNINKMASNSMDYVDIILFMISLDMPLGKGDEYVIEMLKKSDAKKYLIINKIDKAASKSKVLDIISNVANKYDFKEIFPISALTNDNVDRLISVIKTDLEEEETMFSDDEITNYSKNFYLSEIIREKILHLTKEEIPHSVAVTIDHQEINFEGELEIHAIIVVERDSQKGIIIGKNGNMLANINKQAQREIKEYLKQKVYLRLFVKVKSNWRNNEDSLNILGYKVNE